MSNNHHVSKIQIKKSHLEHNLNYFKTLTKANTRIMLVVKASAYGSSMIIVAKSLENQVDYFAVAYLDEGIILRENGITKPILVLHPQEENLKYFKEHNLEPTVYNFNTLKTAKKLGLAVHIKINSGLNRLGFEPEDMSKVAVENVTIISAFSHLSASEDESEHDFTKKQIITFDKASKELARLTKMVFFRHMTNTSGVLNFPQAHFDMIRIGLGIHGWTNSLEYNKFLKKSWFFRSKISQIREIKKGDSIGYNRGQIAEKPMRIAIVPIGHADGYPRPLGIGNGWVIINGQKAYTAGNICMDMILVDITEIKCKESDEVEIFETRETLNLFAKRCKTISYEMLTAIGPRIKRELIS